MLTTLVVTQLVTPDGSPVHLQEVYFTVCPKALIRNRKIVNVSLIEPPMGSAYVKIDFKSHASISIKAFEHPLQDIAMGLAVEYFNYRCLDISNLQLWQNIKP